MASNLEATPAKGDNLDVDHEDYDVCQLLDSESGLEDGEIESSVDEALLDEPTPLLCSICEENLWGMATYEKYIKKSYECMSNELHVYCNPCTYKSMLKTKYCPSGKKCNYPAKAAPWSWHRDVVIECSLTYVIQHHGAAFAG